MNTIKCRIKTNDFSDSPGVGVTPAEVILLRTVHDKHAGGCCIKNAKPSGVAMTTVGQKPATVKSTDGSGIEVEMKTTQPVERERTDAEEIARLRAKYQVRARSGAPGTHIVDDLFGGAGLVAKLPQTFAELPAKFLQGLKIEVAAVAAPQASETEEAAEGVATEALPPAKPQSEPDPASPREELLAMTVIDLRKNAEDLKVENFKRLNTAQLIEAILKKAGYAEPAEKAA